MVNVTNEKIIEMENEAARLRKDEATAAYRKQVQRERDLARAAEHDELIKDGRASVDEKTGRDITHWDVATQEANKATSGSDVYAYNDWRAAMMSLLSMFSTLTKAINHSMSKNVYTPGKDLLMDAGYYFKDKIAYSKLVNDIKDKITGGEEVVLPSLEYLVDVGNDNKLKIGNLVRSDKVDNLGNLNEAFDTVVYEWLDQKGYKKHPDDAAAAEPRMVDRVGALLDKAAFERLKPTLDLFFQENSNLDFTPQNNPRP